MPKPRKFRISDEAVVETIIQLCAAAWPDEAIKPVEIAMTLYQNDWQALTKRIRIAVKQLAEVGHIQILRKGKPANPDDFKGVYSVRLADSFWETPTEPVSTPNAPVSSE